MRTEAEKLVFYEQQAVHYVGEARMLRCRASVHLEARDDELFWDSMLQRYRPGRYNYIYYSNNVSGSETTGCTQCLQYLGFLSEQFFVCIDSDYRYLKQEPNIVSNKFVLQTYTYSWENHYCFAERLQAAFLEKMPDNLSRFDFVKFLSGYSESVYRPLMLFLYMNNNGLKGFSQKTFNELSSIQFRTGDLEQNGQNVIMRLKSALDSVVLPLEASCPEFDFEREKDYYEKLGLTSVNAYLHFRGHNLYNTILSLGNHLCRGTDVDFERDVLKAALMYDKYWEIERCGKDIIGL